MSPELGYDQQVGGFFPEKSEILPILKYLTTNY